MRLAKSDTYGTDAVGVRRQYLAGDQIPDGVDVPKADVREVEDSGLGTTSGTTVPDGDDTYVTDDRGVRRLVKAGDDPAVFATNVDTVAEPEAPVAPDADAESTDKPRPRGRRS